MTEPAQLFRRCGVDLEHDPHPNADDSQCDGHYVPAAAAAEGDGPATLRGILGMAPAPRPWAIPSLTASLADDLADALEAFVGYLNTVHAVRTSELVLGCWPLHPGLIEDLASLYSGWVDGHAGLGATAERSLYWHDRWLRNFYKRLPDHYGVAPDACTPNNHRTNWNPAAALLADAAKSPPNTSAREELAKLRTNPAYLEP